MVADIEELEQMDAPELHGRRLNVKEVLTTMKGDNFIFPVADGTMNSLEKIRIREHPPESGQPRSRRRTS